MRRRFFVAPQVPPLPPRQRVVTTVLAGRLPHQGLMASLASWMHPRDAGLARDALALLGLEDKLWLRVDRLSGGERQRVALARLLVARAELWAADEPLSALDPALSEQCLAVLVREAKARGTTLLTSLHQIELAVAHVPRLVGLARGRVVFDRPAAEVDAGVQRALYANERSAPFERVSLHHGPNAAEAELAEAAVITPRLERSC